MKNIITFLIYFLCFIKLSAQTDSRGVGRHIHQNPKPVFNGNIYAVIVGVSGYKYVTPLKFADRDALLFKAFLQSKSGGNVKSDNIFLALNDDANASTQPRIRKWLTETKKLQKGDRVYFYFAGHGDAIDPDEYFFLLQDCNPGGDPNNYTGGMASVIQMYNIKALIKNDLINNGVEVFLIWDACRSNELPGGETGLTNLQQGVTEKTDGESIMLASSAGEVSLESSIYAHGHGLFTYYLIDGLSGAADNPANDGNGDGKVDMIELENWVKKKVRIDALAKFDSVQVPRFIYNGDATLSIVDSGFENEWAMDKMNESDLVLNHNKTGRGLGKNVQEADSLVNELYNKFMAAVKEDSLDGVQNSAEELYKQLLNKYPDNSLTDQAGFDLAMEYINLAQDKINLYLSGKDDLSLLATSKASKENHSILNQALTISAGKNYGKNGQYLYRALALLKKDSDADLQYMEQIEAKADFLFARSYISNEGLITNFTKALELAKEAMKLQPKAAYNYHLFGSLYYINGQYDSSIYYERNALALAPKWVNALNNMGIAFDAEKNNDSARFYYRKAFATDPDFLIPYSNLSYNFLIDHEYDSAFKYGREALALNPLYVAGNNNLGMIFHNQKIYDSAKIYYQKTIGIDPKNITAYNNLGILFYNEGQYDSSRNYFYKVISIDSLFGAAYYNLGLLFDTRNRHDSARYYYYKAISIDPGNADAYIGLGIIFYTVSLYDSAKTYYQKAIGIDAKNTYAYYNLGLTLFRLKQFDSARRYYNKALAIDPKYANAYNGLFNISHDEKLFDSARIYSYKDINTESQKADAYYNLGFLFFNHNQIDSAKKYFYKTINVDSEYTEGYNDLGVIFLNNKQYDSAKRYFYKAICIDPDFTDAYNNVGLLFYKQRNYGSARDYLYKTITLNSNYLMGYLGVANTFFQQKLYDSAMLYYKAIITLDSLNINAYAGLCICSFLRNNIDSSAYYVKKIILKKIASKDAFTIGGFIIRSYENKKMYDKELEIARLLYNYDSVYDVPGVDNNYKKSLVYSLAYSYLFTGNLASSKYYYEKGGDISDYYYNIACIASLNKKTKEALENLELSFQKGYKDYDHLQRDTDLDNIRNTEEFGELLKKYFPDKMK